ncbi:M1 family metallopeptidase [Zhouia spongiae]|uniref:M1 family metallopeptidase n=1 Tax=Zhouia spongiae TaxID=2202721 RepID=A0ABY3YK45_9FLAO|nr:M1 family metallopeptidase [Zhouia spongiae]UNY97975.1 M1 family metallopeptidase [Zhouia spongiae]
MKKLLLFAFLTGFSLNAQLLSGDRTYTKADTLRGSLRKERNFDVRKYRLNITVNPTEKFIFGSNSIDFVPQENLTTIQIDLFDNMKVDSIINNGKKLVYKREFNAVFIDGNFQKDTKSNIVFYYSGNPIVAKRAPWDGGFVFKKDNNGNDWIATACQGTGASLWWPNKDHQSDEPEEGMSVKVAVPNGLMNVSNGRFKGKKDLGNGYTRWDWEVINPINNYDVALNIGDYVHFGETYKGLDLDYYVLRYNLEKAKVQFEEVKPMMDCFQEKFGEYPFKEDSFKLVETPHLGMEHQSAVAYGNQYKKGYLGSDLSGSGVGLKWDFIIIHETGHEWFGNSITASDIADMWIHESFTSYSENVYTECRWGYEAGQKYVNGTGKMVQNDIPIIGDYGVNSEGSGDMYYKGALMLNTIRHIVDNDEKWWKILRSYSEHFKHQIVTTKDVVTYFEKESGLRLKPVFDQYLRYADIPILEFQQNGKNLLYRWKADVDNFDMPVDIIQEGKEVRLKPSKSWKKLKRTGLNDLKVKRSEFFIKVKYLGASPRGIKGKA